MEYRAILFEECGGSEEIFYEADSHDEARDSARTMLREWVQDGEYGIQGAHVRAWLHVYAPLTDGTEDEILDEAMWIDVDPDDDALVSHAIREAGIRGEEARTVEGCEHDWISTQNVEGGLSENPGVYSLGGTSISIRDHCAHCGLRRHRILLGAQRNPGEADTVEYRIEPEEDE